MSSAPYRRARSRWARRTSPALTASHKSLARRGDFSFFGLQKLFQESRCPQEAFEWVFVFQIPPQNRNEQIVEAERDFGGSRPARRFSSLRTQGSKTWLAHKPDIQIYRRGFARLYHLLLIEQVLGAERRRRQRSLRIRHHHELQGRKIRRINFWREACRERSDDQRTRIQGIDVTKRPSSSWYQRLEGNIQPAGSN